VPSAGLHRTDRGYTLGPAAFDRTGRLTALSGNPVAGPRLRLWRPPTDNDRIGRLHETWLAMGLHRLTERFDDVEAGEELVVRTRAAAAATDRAVRVTYRWTPLERALALRVDLDPEGAWPEPIAKLGVAFTLPRALDHVRWFGRGPGESYPDTGLAARVGRFHATVDELQTPYIRPQENGRRGGVRWATLTDAAGDGIKITGAEPFGLTARRWSDDTLATATHRNQLVAGEHIELSVDVGQHGIGTASCGPGTLPNYELFLNKTVFTLVFEPVKLG
jgi:beta-galactosidase